MSKTAEAQSASRRRAEELLTRKKTLENERLATRDKERKVFDEKTERLRNLRIAKEAAEKPAPASSGAPDAAPAKKRRAGAAATPRD